MTWPNPGVGAVVERDGVVLGQGRHRVCGQEHAEVAAFADCRARGHDPAGATVWVTLAPCTRHGRQPPCVSALAAARVARVVAALPDPVQDDAAAELAAQGIAYEVGVGRELAERIHGGFLSRVLRGRPRITGKWAMSLDGRIARSSDAPTAITTPDAVGWSRRRRRAYDAILVGAGTAMADDPLLRSSHPRMHGGEPGPLRIVVSAQARCSPRLLADARQVPLLVVHDHRGRPDPLIAAGARTLVVDDAHDAPAVAQALGRLGLNDLLVEGGSAIHAAWLPLYDRIETWIGPQVLGEGLSPLTRADTARFRPDGIPRMHAGCAVACWVRDG